MTLLNRWILLIIFTMLFYWGAYKKKANYSYKTLAWILLNFFSIPIITLADISDEKIFYNRIYLDPILLEPRNKSLRKKYNVLVFLEMFYFTLILGSFINSNVIVIILGIIYCFFNLGSILYLITHKLTAIPLLSIMNFVCIIYLIVKYLGK